MKHMLVLTQGYAFLVGVLVPTILHQVLLLASGGSLMCVKDTSIIPYNLKKKN